MQAHDRAMPHRRQVIAGLTASLAASAAWPVRGQSRLATCVLTPQTGEGPFYFDPKLVRSDITEGQPGVPLALDIRVVTADGCAFMPKARVDIWHADARGVYSGYSGQFGNGTGPDRSAPGKTYLRGTQFADTDGLTSFRTIYPSWYRGRAPHIHFKVILESREVAVSQLYFPDKVSDRVYADFSAYKPRSRDRDGSSYNDNDMFQRGRIGGAFCEVTKDSQGYRAAAVIGIAKA
jgi:protocatechuate 3,4-dioxygenase beta subunit